MWTAILAAIKLWLVQIFLLSETHILWWSLHIVKLWWLKDTIRIMLTLVLGIISFKVNLLKHLSDNLFNFNWRQKDSFRFTIKPVYWNSTHLPLLINLLSLIFRWSLARVLITCVLIRIATLTIWSTHHIFKMSNFIGIYISMQILIRLCSRIKWWVKHILFVITT